jgi:bacillopeptidase F
MTAGVAAMLTAVLPAPAGDLDARLQDMLLQAPVDEPVSVLVYLQDRVNVAAVNHELNVRRAALAVRHHEVVQRLQDKAAATQGDLQAHLGELLGHGRIEGFRAFWIDNVIHLEAVPDEIALIALRPDVDRVYFDYEIELIRPVGQAAGNDPVPIGVVEPGVIAVRAPEVWALGITGAGVLVATLDTGVEGGHPALASRWRGLDPAYTGNPEWAWFDPVTNTTFPQSFGSHGTHTMGSVCGGVPGDQVGVAPGAEWMHAAVIDRVSIPQTITDALLAFQWLIDPDGDPGTNFDVPDVCSNSWGLADSHGIPDCDEFFWPAMDACEAAGIVMLFSAGNEGSGGLRRPADRATDEFRNLAVASVNANVAGWPVSGFSSRGPTVCTPDGSLAIKPDISAPGENVRSSVPGGGYASFSGTSMASPHVNGVVALMRQANPEISVDDVKQIIYNTAVDLGTAGKDNDYGWGMIDAFEAVQLASGDILFFSFPAGRPDVIDPNGGTVIPVVVTGPAIPQPGTGTLHLSTGGPFTAIAMTETAPGEYDAVFPAVACLADVQYYFSVDAESGDTFFNPFDAPVGTYSAEAFSGVELSFRDHFGNDLGWTVQDDIGLTTGTWERGIPIPNSVCDRGNPGDDADESGWCYLTENSSANACDTDIDGGTTTLTSPIMDATDPDGVLGYNRWYSNSTGGDPNNDIFVVEVSDDDGASWVTLEIVGPAGPGVSGGWIRAEFPIADIAGVSNTDQFRVRFRASDLAGGSVVEAGVDTVEIFSRFCKGNGCAADLDGDNEVGITDFLALLAAWGPNPGHPADLDDDGTVGVTDFLALLDAWGPCP